MKMLMVYATNSGSTYTVGTLIKGVLEKAGHTVVLKKAIEASPSDLQGIDCLLVGSPSWRVNGKEGQIQETMQDFLDSCRGKIPVGMKFAVFGCGDPDFTMFCMAVDSMNAFLLEEKGKQLCDPLKIDGFYFHVEKNSSTAERWAQQLLAKM